MVLQVEVVEGDLCDQDCEVLVNAWNRNVIPWWLLIPQGVSGAIKRRAGLQPFREVGRAGPMKLGSAVLTSAGRLPHRGIIHVAGINMFWRATRSSIQDSVAPALALCAQHGFASVAFPILGAGSGGFQPEAALGLMQEQIEACQPTCAVRLVRYRKGA